MKTMTKIEFEALAQQLRHQLPTAHVDVYPSAFGCEIRLTPKLAQYKCLMCTATATGVSVKQYFHHTRTHRLKCFNVPSVTTYYITRQFADLCA